MLAFCLHSRRGGPGQAGTCVQDFFTTKGKVKGLFFFSFPALHNQCREMVKPAINNCAAVCMDSFSRMVLGDMTHNSISPS